MSDSPQSAPKDVDQGAPQTPDEEGQMNDSHDPQSAGGPGYEFEGVKEQDRWLPIANGMSSSSDSTMICPTSALFFDPPPATPTTHHEPRFVERDAACD